MRDEGTFSGREAVLDDAWLSCRENVWLVFVFWNLVLNTALCLGTIGPATLAAVYGEVSGKDFALVCLFSFLWGSGTAGYSVGIQLVS